MAWGEPMAADQDFADLDFFDSPDLKPEKPFTQGLESLPDGDYDFEITQAELTTTQKSADRILRTKLKVNGGAEIEKAWFLKTQDNVNALLADLCALGFPANKWGQAHGQPLKVALPAAVKQLPGVRFRGRKASRPKQDKPNEHWHDLHIGGRIQGKPMPTPPGEPERRPAPPQQPALAAPAESDPF